MLVAIFLILATVAATHWSFIKKREKEEELIFRGNQYVRALELYFKKFKTYPNKLEELYNEKCIRKLWPDPMTEDGKWVLIRGNSPQSGAKAAEEAAKQKPEEKKGTFAPSESSFVKASGIIGVRSKSVEKSIREYNKKRFYHEWIFVVGADEKNKQKSTKQNPAQKNRQSTSTFSK